MTGLRSVWRTVQNLFFWSPGWTKVTLATALVILLLIAIMSRSDNSFVQALIADAIVIGVIIYVLADIGFLYNIHETHRQRPTNLDDQDTIARTLNHVFREDN